MLLRFAIENYKSFVEKTEFSMTPAPRQTGLDYSIIKEKTGRKIYQGLSSAVIYGPNASGKTNLIGALDTLKRIVERGNIHNAEQAASTNPASAYLELIPNCRTDDRPTSFSISFTQGGLYFAYSLRLQLGDFLQEDAKRKVLYESLLVNEKTVFVRDEKLQIEVPSILKKYFSQSAIKKFSTIKEIATDSLNDADLFLCNGFKTIVSPQLAALVLDWFAQKLMVLYRADATIVQRKMTDAQENKIYIERTLTEAAKVFGVTGNALGYRTDGEQTQLCSIISNKDKNFVVTADVFESFGTLRFLNEFPLVILAMLNGATLVADEFDASIHPMALMNIVNLFHNDEINKNHAQLIFNTHNPIFLDSSLFRRDEIKFVERDEHNASVQYALSDFKTADGVRKGEDYMHNYFVSRYGAIREIDFAPVLEKIMVEQAEAQDD